MENNIRILCAAIRYKTSDGAIVVIPCLRHMDGYHFVEAIGLSWNDIVEEGFLNEHWQFMNRSDAYKAALAIGQVSERPDYPILFSEDLY